MYFRAICISAKSECTVQCDYVIVFQVSRKRYLNWEKFHSTCLPFIFYYRIISSISNKYAFHHNHKQLIFQGEGKIFVICTIFAGAKSF